MTFYEWLDSKRGASKLAQDGSMSLASFIAKEVAQKVRLPDGARRLLDLGGGHGLYSVEFCLKYRELSAIVFDLPTALRASSSITRKEIK